MGNQNQNGHFSNRTQKTLYEKNRKYILQKCDTCAICGRPVDKKLKFPHPMSATVDHIIPIAKGGHPFDLDNLQLAHNKCNRFKSDKLPTVQVKKDEHIGNRNLPKSIDWENYAPGKGYVIKPRKNEE